jgi:hypothetical protein
MRKLLSFLKATKVFDPDNTLSLSNVAMMVIVARLAVAPNLDWTILTAFFVTLLNHNARKHWAKTKASKEIADQEKLKELEETVKKLHLAAQAKKLGG